MIRQVCTALSRLAVVTAVAAVGLFGATAAHASTADSFTAQDAALVDTAGHRYPVLVDTHTTALESPDGVTHYATTTRVRVQSLPGSGAAPTAAGSVTVQPMSSWGGCDNDPSSIVMMCLSQFFDQTTSGGLRYVSINRYSASWTRLDSQFALIHGHIHAGVTGPCLNNSCFLSQTQDGNWDSPANGSTYSLYPSWGGTYVLVDGAIHFQCGNSDVTMSRRGTLYTFQHVNVCQGSP